MDTLFNTELIANGTPQTFAVSFHDEQYIFKSLTGNTTFSLRREEDEWHSVEEIDGQLKNAAVDKLESYLLSQH